MSRSAWRARGFGQRVPDSNAFAGATSNEHRGRPVRLTARIRVDRRFCWTATRRPTETTVEIIVGQDLGHLAAKLRVERDGQG
jgi:hypothetical protein